MMSSNFSYLLLNKVCKRTDAGVAVPTSAWLALLMMSSYKPEQYRAKDRMSTCSPPYRSVPNVKFVIKCKTFRISSGEEKTTFEERLEAESRGSYISRIAE